MTTGAGLSGTSKLASLAEVIRNLDTQTSRLESQFSAFHGDFDIDVSIKLLAFQSCLPD